MRLIFLLIMPFLINSCASDDQKKSELFIKNTINKSWEDILPLDALLIANNICKQNSEYQGCNTIDEQLYDLSITFNSCVLDQRSKLCQALVIIIGKHEIFNVLPKVNSLKLPSNSFYWDMQTKALGEQSSKYSYRSESMSWWLEKWKFVIYFMALLLLSTFGLYHYRIYRKERQLEIDLDNQEKISHQIENEKFLVAQAQQAKEIERQKLEAKKAADVAEQQRVEVENRIAQEFKLANEKAEKLAEEKAEAEALLDAIFKRNN